MWEAFYNLNIEMTYENTFTHCMEIETHVGKCWGNKFCMDRIHKALTFLTFGSAPCLSNTAFPFPLA